MSDPAVEESPVGLRADAWVRRHRPGIATRPDEITICRFRHLLGKKVFAAVNEYLKASGLRLSTDPIVDAAIIGAPSSARNRDCKRDPEIHQTKKGNQWLFAMKAHIGVAGRAKLIHSIQATAANVHDATVLPSLAHGGEPCFYGDRAYCGHAALIGLHDRGLAKNGHRLKATPALANLFIARSHLVAMQA